MNKLSQTSLKIINEKFCRKNTLVPIFEDKDKIIFYSRTDDDLLKFNLGQLTGKEIEFLVKQEDLINKEIENLFANKIDNSILNEILINYKEINPNLDLEDSGEDAPVVKVLNYILNLAISRDASDIHIENLKDEILVRYRIDGSLHELSRFPKVLYPYLITRIKVMSKLDIAEKRLPQDGRFSYPYKGRNIDVRVAISPTAYGEKIVFRILDVDRVIYTPEGIGLIGENYKKVINLVNQPQGLILITGPTSSGENSIIVTDTIIKLNQGLKASTKFLNKMILI